jgi:thioredoxin 1
MDSFQTIMGSDQLVLIDFYATWCGPCQMMPPILKQLKQNLGEKIRILKIDVDKNPKVAAHHQVRGVPTLILMAAGKTLWRQSGVVDAQSLTDIISQFLDK